MDMELARNTAITFFFAIFWGTAISSMRTYKVFHIWTLNRKGNGIRVVFRLAVGVIILNVVPLLIYYFIYTEPWFQIVPPKSPAMFICAGVSSLSVFSIVFLLPGIMQLGLGRLLYAKAIDKDDDKEIKESWVSIAKGDEEIEDISKKDGSIVFFVTAILYIVVPIIASSFIAKILIAG
ncbi:MAG: hypothetical protein P9L89_05360 [Candidatus Celaenobacter polaris]|nr:hypothetical protein [Candidatus Celaenobacter polaris]